LLRPIILAAAAVCLSLPIAAQSGYAVNRVVAPIDETSLVPLKGNVHPMAQARYDRGPAPEPTPTGRVMLLLARSAAQQQALTQYLADVQNPSSPNYRKWLTPAQYGASYGISDADLQTVEGWLEGHGFKIEKVPQARNVIEFSGNFGQVQSAFHTTMHSLVVNGENHFANMTDPQIPAALAPVIAGVGPLNDFHPRRTLVMGPRGHYDASTHTFQPDPTLTYVSASGDFLYVDPADAATIYDTPNLTLNANYKSGTNWDGTGIKLGIAGDSDVNPIDVGLYRYAFINNQGTAGTSVPTVVVDGNDPGYNGDEIEALLDNEVAGGLAPGASLYFYTGANTDLSAGLFNAIIRALDDNTVSILNISFISCEAGLGSSGNEFIFEEMEQAAGQGISVTVAAGDSGSAGCDNDNTETEAQNGFAVNGLASTPYNIAVGGTDYDVLGSAFSTYAGTTNTPPYYETALGYIPERPWNDSTSINTSYSSNTPLLGLVTADEPNIVAGGGGLSAVYSKPSFQESVTPADSARDLPDVSFLAADGLYGAAWLVCGDSVVEGATSGSEPTTYDCETTNGVLANGSTFIGVGGTSAAAPAFAGMLALVAQSQGGVRLGQVDPILYGLAANKTTYASDFHDVTVGDNSVVCASGSTDCGSNGFLTGYNAGTGYDSASGLGSVDVKALISNWTSVTLASTSTTFKINGSTASYSGTHGANVTLNVGVTPSSATGVVAIVDDANLSAGGTLNNGQLAIPLTSGSGSASYNGLPGGQYTVTARYGGDASNAASTSAGISVDISAEPSTTTLAVDAYNPQTYPATSSQLGLTSIPYGSVVVLDAQIAGKAEGQQTEGIATGTVTFKNGSTTLGTANVGTNGNLASWPPLSSGYVALAPGSYNAMAVYSGDASFSTSTSTPVTFSVAQATTTTAASANPTTVASGGSTTVTVNLSTAVNDGAQPTGTVALAVGGNTVTINLSAFTASETTSNNVAYVVLTGSGTVPASDLASGTNTITVTYSGDTNYAGSAATPLTVTGPSGGSGSASIALTSSGNISVNPGATSGNTATITVTPGGGFTGAVNLTCAVTTSISNPNDPPTCTIFTPVTISGTTAVTATMTISTTASSTSALEAPLRKFFLGGGATLAMLFFFGVPARRRAWRTALSAVAILFVAGAIGCGGGGGGTKTIQGTTAGTYTVTVTGADAATGKVTSNVAVTVTVN
jgi:trimeric autotransporter adhesin